MTDTESYTPDTENPSQGFDLSHPIVVAFAGYAGSGKDTAAGFLREFLSHFSWDPERPSARLQLQATSLARPVKETLKYIYNLSDNDVYGHEDRAARERPHPHLNGHSPRYAMQKIATEGYRDLIDYDTWVAHWYRNIYLEARSRINTVDGPPVLHISDFRFRNEYNFIAKRCPNLLLFYIDRQRKTRLQQLADDYGWLAPLLRPFGIRRNHVSEREVDYIKGLPGVQTLDNRYDQDPGLIASGDLAVLRERSMEYFRGVCMEAFLENFSIGFYS